MREEKDSKWERLSNDYLAARAPVNFATNRMINPTSVAEGSNLPPKVVQGIRVLQPSRFRALKQTEESGQTRIVLAWENDAMMQRYNPRYRIKMRDALKGGEFQSLLVSTDPPCEIVIPGPNSQRTYILTIETILSNGLTSLESSNPTCSVKCFALA